MLHSASTGHAVLQERIYPRMSRLKPLPRPIIDKGALEQGDQQRRGLPPQEGGRSGQEDFLAALERRGVVRRPLLESDLRWDIAFIWRRDAYLSRAAQAWLELLDESPAP